MGVQLKQGPLLSKIKKRVIGPCSYDGEDKKPERVLQAKTEKERKN